MKEIKTEELSLTEKLFIIQTYCGVVKKDKKGFNYKYADIEKILAGITAYMRRYRVDLYPSIVPGTTQVNQITTTNTKFDKTGKMYDETKTELEVHADMIFTWVNLDNTDEKMVVPWVVVGMQSDPSQAFGSGLTYCTRYFLTNYFKIAQTENDVDTYRSQQQAATAMEDKQIAESIIEEFDKQLNAYLLEHQDKAKEIKMFVSKYVKDADYFKIKEPALASRLLNDFKELITKESK